MFWQGNVAHDTRDIHYVHWHMKAARIAAKSLEKLDRLEEARAYLLVGVHAVQVTSACAPFHCKLCSLQSSLVYEVKWLWTGIAYLLSWSVFILSNLVWCVRALMCSQVL